MDAFFSAATLLEIMKAWGPFGAIFAIWYFQYLSEERRRRAEIDERERDRQEHIAKWDAMSKVYEDSVTRAHSLLDKQGSAISLQASLFSSMVEKIEKNQFCPLVRQNTKGG